MFQRLKNAAQLHQGFYFSISASHIPLLKSGKKKPKPLQSVKKQFQVGHSMAVFAKRFRLFQEVSNLLSVCLIYLVISFNFFPWLTALNCFHHSVTARFLQSPTNFVLNLMLSYFSPTLPHAHWTKNICSLRSCLEIIKS